MFNFVSEDKFLLKNFINLFAQKGMKISNSHSKKTFFTAISFIKDDKFIKIVIEGSQVKLPLPTSSKKLFLTTYDLLSQVVINYKTFQYSPILQLIIYKNKKLYLKNIHNSIFSLLLLNRQNGISKKDIYSEIWPIDKEIQGNKLDTHLTNLKNELQINLDFKLIYFSSRGVIKLIIN